MQIFKLSLDCQVNVFSLSLHILRLCPLVSGFQKISQSFPYVKSDAAEKGHMRMRFPLSIFNSCSDITPKSNDNSLELQDRNFMEKITFQKIVKISWKSFLETTTSKECSTKITVWNSVFVQLWTRTSYTALQHLLARRQTRKNKRRHRMNCNMHASSKFIFATKRSDAILRPHQQLQILDRRILCVSDPISVTRVLLE